MELNKGDIGTFLFDPLQPLTLWEYIGKTMDGFHVFKCGNTMREIKPDQLTDFWRILPAR